MILMKNREEQVLAYLFGNPNSIRKQILDNHGLRRNTVTEVCADLIREGKIVEVDENRRRNIRLKINPDSFLSIGVEHTENEMLLAILNADREILDTCRVPLPPNLTGTARCERIAREVQRAMGTDCRAASITGIGFADIGMVDRQHGRSIMAVARPDWEDVPVCEILERQCGKPVSLFNSVDPHGAAELMFGPADMQTEVIFVILHNRVGMSIHSEEGLFRTRAGITGELGHVVVQPDGVVCKCGNRGCLETVASTDAIVEKVRVNGHHPDISLDRVLEDARNGQKLARLAVEEAACALGSALANIINVIGVTSVLIKSPLVDAGDAFLAPLEHTLAGNCIYPLNKQITVTPGTTDIFAGAVGAAWLVLKERFTPPHGIGVRVSNGKEEQGCRNVAQR